LRNYLLFLFLVFFATAKAQEITVDISASDDAMADSLTVVTRDMVRELKKAGSFEFSYKKSENKKSRNTMAFKLRQQADESGLDYPKALRSYNPEGYYINSSAGHVTFIGNSVLALQQAVFDYLEQLGFRYFLPGEAWEIIPSISTPFINYEKLTQPFYEFRSLANGQGFYRNKKVEGDFNFWAKANRLGGSFPIRVGHSYQTVVTNNIETFKKHPEYFADKVDKTGAPSAAKFDVANKQLVELVINDAKKRLDVFKKTGQFVNMISMEPSDGGGFCTSPGCLKIGSASDQVFYLTNAVARAVQKDYPGIWVGNLAYNEHIEPTKYDLEPNVFVMVTNGFNRTKFTTNEMLEKWSKKAKKVGVYEYLSVYAWDNDLPGRANATHLDFLKKSIQGYYENGARVYLAETNIGWISKGLGQYITSKLLWDYHLNVDSLAEDFYSKSFGNAAPVMKRLYKSWESSSGGMISDNALAQWLGWVNEADGMANDNRVKERLNQIKIYLHYLVLYRKLKTNPTIENLNQVMSFAYRTFDVSAFATVPVMTSLPFYSGFKGNGLYDKKDHLWMKNATQLNSKELNSLFISDLKSVKKVEGLQSVEYGKRFSKNEKMKPIARMKPGNTAPSFTGETTFLIRIDKRSTDNFLDIKSGYAARPADAKTVKIKIFKYLQYQALKDEADIVFTAEQSEKMVEKRISLQTLEAGDYLMKVEDQFKMFSLKLSPPISFSVIMSAEKSLLTSSVTGLNTFYFSVLPGAKRFIIHKTKVLKLISPAGRLLEFMSNNQESIVVEVKENETGLWQIFAQAGSLYIEGVPPYLGVIPEKMLVPADVNRQ
jgi:Domain of unknown function (DUF4838)